MLRQDTAYVYIRRRRCSNPAGDLRGLFSDKNPLVPPPIPIPRPRQPRVACCFGPGANSYAKPPCGAPGSSAGSSHAVRRTLLPPWPPCSSGLSSRWLHRPAPGRPRTIHEVCFCIHLKCLRILYWVLGFHMIILGGKRHVFLFPPRALHGFVHPGKILRHLRWMQEQTSVVAAKDSGSLRHLL